jgi:nicotinate-nucleotide adenylyltransferase
MVAAVAEEEPKFEASRIEIDRDGPSYTADTLDEIAKSHPNASLFLILGLDSFLDLPHWKSPEKILSRARLLVVKRPRLRHKFPEVLEGHYDLLPFSETELSSTRVRDSIESGAPFDELVPAPVARLITTKRIYRVDR